MSTADVIVVVDDEPFVLRALVGTLARRLGARYAIERAGNGAEARALIEELGREGLRLRLVVTDAMMPVMDGYALVEWLHLDMPHVPAIMVTGYGLDARIEQLRQRTGLVAALDKPWSSEALVTAVTRALGEPVSPGA